MRAAWQMLTARIGARRLGTILAATLLLSVGGGWLLSRQWVTVEPLQYQPEYGRVFVLPTINGRVFRFQITNAFPATTLFPPGLARLAPTLSGMDASSVNGEMSLGHFGHRQYFLLVNDRTAASAGEGVICPDFFEPFEGLASEGARRGARVTFDFPRQTLIISTAPFHLPSFAFHRPLVAPIHKNARGVYVASISLNRGPKLDFAIGFGDEPSVVLPRSVLEIAPDASGYVPLRHRTPCSLLFNDREIPIFVIPGRGQELNGVLGMEFLQRYRVTIDYGAKLLILE